MTRIIGIDLGTTNSCAAIFQDGRAVVVPGPAGERTIPSVVAFNDAGKVLVGVAAKRQAVTNPERTFHGVKRLIGRKLRAPDVQRFAKGVGFRLVEASNGDARIAAGDQRLSPPEISSYVLEHLRRQAEAMVEEPITQAVITVPAYFDDAQRQATRDAGRIAGLDVRRIVNEPTAAVLGYGVHRKKDRQTLAVVDLGGGTFDVSILRVEKGVFQVLSTSGDATLGGDDWDAAVVAWLLEGLSTGVREEAAASPTARLRLREAAETAKRQLSDEQTAPIALAHLAGSGGGVAHLERSVERRTFEDLTAPLRARLAAPCERALAGAHLTPGQLDEVLLVGGMTRVPSVATELARLFARQPQRGAHPDEIVALGAATHGAILSGVLEDVVLCDVTSHALGIKLGESSFSIVLPANARLPARVTRTFATVHDDQRHVMIEVYQGEAQDVRQNRKLGKFTLEGLPAARAGAIQVEIVFEVDVDGIVNVRARESGEGRSAALRIEPSGGLDKPELDRIFEGRRAALARGA